VPEPDAAFLGEEHLLEHGYALAASGFRGAGYNVREGIKDNKYLTDYFIETVGEPERTILYGVSMGGIITLKSMEKYPGTYNGGVPLCTVASGLTRSTAMRLTYALSYDQVFGWPDSWGKVNDVRDDIDFYGDVWFPKVMAEIFDPANYAKWEFIRLVGDLPMGGFYSYTGPVPMPQGVIAMIFFMTAQRAELEVRAGGAVSDNMGYVYNLNDAEKAYLWSLDPTLDLEGMLAEMNMQTGYQADPWAQSYLDRYGEFRGQIHGPVLLAHNIEDPITPVEGTTEYADLVMAKGQDDLLLRVYSELPGHCNFTDNQVLTILTEMDNWLKTGEKPSQNAFPEILGFVHGYEPGQWPQPPTQ
jgi:pimeloyl-ACP methyl ester carboxylesterase